jgi:hypothetical protein
MTALLSPRLWAAIVVAVLLAAAGWKAYVMGENHIRAEWNVEKLAQAETSRLREMANRKTEQQYSANALGALNASKKREQVAIAAAAGARSELVGLRNSVAAFVSPDLSSDTLNASRKRASTIGELLDQCADALTELAAKADRHASDTLTLQQAWPR